eukprot:620107-Pyramimonas_sp.AAC.1
MNFLKSSAVTKQAVLERFGKAHPTQTTENSGSLHQLAMGTKAKKGFVKDFVSHVDAMRTASDKLGKSSMKLGEVRESLRTSPRRLRVLVAMFV